MSTPGEHPQDETSTASSPSSACSIRGSRPATEAWQRRAAGVGGWLTAQLHRPRTRLAVIGVILLLLAVLDVVSSVWTLPLVIGGAVMVLVAWIGSRLDGRFAIEWGESGTQVEFRAQIKAPPAPPRRVRSGLAPAPAPAGVPAVRIPTLAELDDGDVIEGEGHTVEIDVAELKALIVAAEAKDAATAAPRGHPAPGSASERRRPAA
ncbi:MAG: hypothetical protein ACRDNK_12885 [Solirubrobacteraceae bacterium]